MIGYLFAAAATSVPTTGDPSAVAGAFFRVGCAAGALLAFVACEDRGERPIAWETRPDTGCCGSDTDIDTSGDDSDEPVEATGALSVVYTWDPGPLTVASCDDAGLDVISVVLVGDVRDPIVFPCADQALRVFDLPVGNYRVAVVGGEAPGITWESEPTMVYVAADQTTEVPSSLTCRPNGMDDGCDGT